MLTAPQSDDGPLAAYVFKTVNDRFVGTLNFFRIFSGSIKSGGSFYNVDSNTDEKFNALLTMRGKEQITVTTLHAGDIGVVAKLNHTKTGDTFTTRSKPLHIAKPDFPEPLFAVAVLPRTQADSAKMGVVLTGLCQADPTLRWRQDPDVKQTIVEGMGEAHVNLAISRAHRLGTNMDMEIPKVPYKEAITKSHSDFYRHKKQSGGTRSNPAAQVNSPKSTCASSRTPAAASCTRPRSSAARSHTASCRRLKKVSNRCWAKVSSPGTPFPM